LLTFTCGAILFDMDGTLVDSTACVTRVWRVWAQKHNVDLAWLLRISHGRRTEDTLREIAPHLDIEAEVRSIDAVELETREGIQPVAGALPLVASLGGRRWAVVTSAGRELATVRLQAAGLPLPPVMVSSEDVAYGKPDPEGYLRAASLLGLPASECVVVEDAPSGILAAQKAGMRVLALSTTYAPEDLLGAPVVPDFHAVRFVFD
jgi:sugar-phosphatase